MNFRDPDSGTYVDFVGTPLLAGVEGKAQVRRKQGSIHVDLKLDHLYVIYPGTQLYSLDSRITVLPMTALAEKLDFL